MQTLVITKETYKSLKWLQQFISKDLYRDTLTKVHIVGGSLAASNGYTLGRIDIPEELKDYCKGKLVFELVKLTTSPYLLIVQTQRMSKKDQETYLDLQKQFKKLIADTKEIAWDDYRFASLDPSLIKTMGSVPNKETVSFYSKDPKEMTVALSASAMAILMPRHFEGKHKPKEEGDGEEAPTQNIEQKDAPKG